MIRSMAELESIYTEPVAQSSVMKEVTKITAEYKRLIEAAPFAVLATSGPVGLDCSPRGDAAGFVRVLDSGTLALPDRRGNNRIDSLRNIVRDPRVALLFMIPGLGTTVRVNGNATISVDPDLLASFAVEGKTPRSVIVITVHAVYFQCARAILRSKLWDPANHGICESLPTPGEILETLSNGEVEAAHYDAEWPQRAAKTLW